MSAGEEAGEDRVGAAFAAAETGDDRGAGDGAFNLLSLAASVSGPGRRGAHGSQTGTGRSVEPSAALGFKVIHSAGDAFVKTNVIVRLLRSEVDHVQKDDPALTSLTPANYVFSRKSTTTLDGRPVHIYQVKPRTKRLGLFKGRIYLDSRTGTLVQTEGSIVKSPSVFIKSIHFVQNYIDIAGFTFPSHIHSEVRTRIVGSAVVDIYDQDYRPVSSAGHAVSDDDLRLQSVSDGHQQ